MSWARLLAAVLIGAVLVGLLGWQLHRERLVKGCLDAGGSWDGRSCGPLRTRPILRRELHHSARMLQPRMARSDPRDRVEGR